MDGLPGQASQDLDLGERIAKFRFERSLIIWISTSLL